MGRSFALATRSASLADGSVQLLVHIRQEAGDGQVGQRYLCTGGCKENAIACIQAQSPVVTYLVTNKPVPGQHPLQNSDQSGYSHFSKGLLSCRLRQQWIPLVRSRLLPLQYVRLLDVPLRFLGHWIHFLLTPERAIIWRGDLHTFSSSLLANLAFTKAFTASSTQAQTMCTCAICTELLPARPREEMTDRITPQLPDY